VNYKLTRASEILGTDLSSLDDRLELDLCYKLMDMR
jgi:DNA-binding PucR family transcriptional regulator